MQVVSRWRSIARLLGLPDDFPGNENRRGGEEKDRFAVMLRLWKAMRPDTYSVGMLETVLAREVGILLSYSL